MSKYYITDADGDIASSETGGKVTNVEVLAIATTLTIADSGKEFSLQGATDGAAITLPAVATSAGFSCEFVVGSAFATTDWTIVSATSIIEGSAVVAGAVVAAINENTISFVASAESVGDRVKISCDGTSYLVSGDGVGSGSITFTDA